MPKVADENRAYVMCYPGQVKTTLQKAWGLRKHIRHRANKSQRQKPAAAVKPVPRGGPTTLPNSEQRRWKKAGISGGKGLLCM